MYNQNAFFEAGRGSIYDSPPKSKPKSNANQQAAKSMGSVGIGGIGGKPTKTAAQKIQDQFRRETQRDSGSTYDEVPQVVGLGSPLSPAPMPENKNRHPMDKINQAFNAMLVSVGLREPTPTENPYKPVAVYSSELFKAPSVETILQMPKVRDLSAPYNPDTRPTDVRAEGDLPKDTAMVAGSGITTPDVNRVSPTLPKQGLMSKPGTPQELKGIPRGLAMANADEPTAKYEIQAGDTLSEIADATGTTVEELAKLNDIKEVDLIEAGADIEIPIRTMRDKSVVTQAKSMEELKPIKASFRDVDPDAEFYSSFTQGITPPEMMQTTGEDEYTSADYMSELEILARTIQAEAGGESKKGKLAVGSVIKNRADQNRFGNDIRSVILFPAQFSPWNTYTNYEEGKEQGKDMLGKTMKPSKDSYDVAKQILSGKYIDPTGGATHFVNPKVGKKPSWYDDLKEHGIMKIGKHEFGDADKSNWQYSSGINKSLRPKARPLGLPQTGTDI